MFKVHIMIGIFQGWPRKILESYKVVSGLLICQYTFQCTSCILCETGGLEAYWHGWYIEDVFTEL